MKKGIIFIAVAAMFLTFGINSYAKRNVSKNTCNHVISLIRERGKCACGGRLTFSAKCFAQKVPCPRKCWENGGQIYAGNGRWVPCNVCGGKGYYIQYYPGYICTRCGAKYQI